MTTGKPSLDSMRSFRAKKTEGDNVEFATRANCGERPVTEKKAHARTARILRRMAPTIKSTKRSNWKFGIGSERCISLHKNILNERASLPTVGTSGKNVSEQRKMSSGSPGRKSPYRTLWLSDLAVGGYY